MRKTRPTECTRGRSFPALSQIGTQNRIDFLERFGGWEGATAGVRGMSGKRERVPPRSSGMDLVPVGPNPEEDLGRLAAAREQFLSHRRLPAGLRPLIRRSWPRSAQFGVAPDARRLDALHEPRIESRLARAAAPVLAGLSDLIQTTHSAVILADADGIVADVRGDADVRRSLQRVYPVPGGVLSEDLAGTNAIGTAIEEGIGVQVWSGEHLIQAFQGFLCTAVPIRDPLSSRILGVLDLTIRDRDVSPDVARL